MKRKTLLPLTVLLTRPRWHVNAPSSRPDAQCWLGADKWRRGAPLPAIARRSKCENDYEKTRERSTNVA